MKLHALGLLLLALPACSTRLGEESLRTDLHGTAKDLCSFEPRHQHGPGVVLDFGSLLYLLLPDLRTDDGRLIPSAGATTGGGRPLCEGDLAYAEEGGVPVEILPRTEAERALEVESEEAARVALWPLSGFVHEGVGTVFYEKVIVRGFFEIEHLGVGVARIETGGIAERQAAGGLLWRATRFRWGVGSVAGRDGYAYVYGCDLDDAWTQPCAIARVPIDRAGESEAYEYLDLSGGWSSEVAHAVPSFEGAASISARWNAHLGRFLLVSAPLFSDTVMARSPAAPSGPFARTLEPEPLFTRSSSSDFGLGNVQQLAAEGRRVSFLLADPPALRVVELELP